MWGIDTAAGWGVVAAVAYDLLTLGLIVAAIYNYRALRSQTKSAQAAANNQLDEARKLREDAVRPHLFLDKVTLLPDSATKPTRMVEVRVKNVGRGAAIDVCIDAWVTRIPPGTIPGRTSLWEPFVKSALAAYEARLKPASGRADLMGLGERTDEICYLMTNNSTVIPDADSADSAFVVARIWCFDQYGKRHDFPDASGPNKVAAHWRVAQLENRPPVLR